MAKEYEAMVEVREGAHNQRRIRVISQSLDVDEMVVATVSNAATSLLAAFWKPFTRYGLKRFQGELGSAIHRLWSQLPGKKKGV